MKKVLVTGATGFVGKNLVSRLRKMPEVEIVASEKGRSLANMDLGKIDFVVHLAGVNRPENPADHKLNVELAKDLCSALNAVENKTPILFSSTYQAGNGSDYGQSKLAAENVFIEHAKRTKTPLYIYRLPGLFGKWCKPNYNSVVATFCHNIARNLPIRIDDPNHVVELQYIDDVVEEILGKIGATHTFQNEKFFHSVPRAFKISVGELASKIRMLDQLRETINVPNLADEFTRFLFSTYTHYLPPERWNKGLIERADARGSLFEVIRSEHAGQIFISTTKPGVTRGNHFHQSKVERFCVLSGKALVRFRCTVSNATTEVLLDGSKPSLLDIPPGHTHSIENVSDQEIIVMFWANEPFDANRPDTYFEEVKKS